MTEKPLRQSLRVGIATALVLATAAFGLAALPVAEADSSVDADQGGDGGCAGDGQEPVLWVRILNTRLCVY